MLCRPISILKLSELSKAVSVTTYILTNNYYWPEVVNLVRRVVTGRFAHKTFPPGRIQRFLVTLYILSFIIVKLHLTTFVKASSSSFNDDEDPAYSVKTQALGAKRRVCMYVCVCMFIIFCVCL